MALTAALQIVLAFCILLHRLLQVAALILVIQQLEVVISLGQGFVESVIVCAPMLVTDVELGL